MTATLEITPGEDRKLTFKWVQDGVPVDLRLSSVDASLRNSDGSIVLPADTIEWGQDVGAVDVYFTKTSTAALAPGSYVLQLWLTYVDGFTQPSDCIPVQVGSCAGTSAVSWG
jgi:hypothetical protein